MIYVLPLNCQCKALSRYKNSVNLPDACFMKKSKWCRHSYTMWKINQDLIHVYASSRPYTFTFHWWYRRWHSRCELNGVKLNTDVKIVTSVFLSWMPFHQIKKTFLINTRNAVCGTWYLPHSRVYKSIAELCRNFGDSAINTGQIGYFSLRMRETPIILLPVKNLTPTPTPISDNTREFWRYVNI